jgi:hypothetical protein
MIDRSDVAHEKWEGVGRKSRCCCPSGWRCAGIGSRWLGHGSRTRYWVGRGADWVANVVWTRVEMGPYQRNPSLVR